MHGVHRYGTRRDRVMEAVAQGRHVLLEIDLQGARQVRRALPEATFVFLNIFGFGLPTDLTPMQEMQYSQLWHSIMAIFLIVVIIGHIYIGTVGMQGAFDAMGTGQVDRNWAQEHHPIWLEEEEKA